MKTFKEVAKWGWLLIPICPADLCVALMAIAFGLMLMLYFPIIDTYWPSWMPFVGGKEFQFFAPVFNFADSCVTVGALYLIFFQYRFFARGDEAAGKGKDEA